MRGGAGRTGRCSRPPTPHPVLGFYRKLPAASKLAVYGVVAIEFNALAEMLLENQTSSL